MNSDSIISNYYNKISKQMGYAMYPPESLINALGNYYLTNKRLEKAEAFYKMNTVNYPQSIQSLNCLGLFYEKYGDRQKAVECYTKELLIKENSATRRKIEKLQRRK